MHVANALPLAAEMPAVNAAASRHPEDKESGFALLLQRARKTGKPAAGGRTDDAEPRPRDAGSQHPTALGLDALPGSAIAKAGKAADDDDLVARRVSDAESEDLSQRVSFWPQSPLVGPAMRHDNGKRAGAGLDVQPLDPRPDSLPGVTDMVLPSLPTDDTGFTDNAAPSAPHAAEAFAAPIQRTGQPPGAATDAPTQRSEVMPARGPTESTAPSTHGPWAIHPDDEPAPQVRSVTVAARAWASQAGRTASRSASEDAAADAADRSGNNIADRSLSSERRVDAHSAAPETTARAPDAGVASQSPPPLQTPSPSSPPWTPNGVRVGLGVSVGSTPGERYPDKASAAAPTRLLAPGVNEPATVRIKGEVVAADDRFDAPGASRTMVARDGKPAEAAAGTALTRGMEPVFRPAHSEGPLSAGAFGVGLSPQHIDTTALTAALINVSATALRPAPVDMAVAESPAREIHAPLLSQGFAPALGAQLSLMVRDGVAEAMLHIHPAEMGPIAVQIQIEGQNARVEMVAEQAVTRQVLEQSMPSLASALRDSGLTLTGGGVFEQSTRQGQPGDTPTPQRGPRPGDAGSAEVGTSADLSAGAHTAGRLAWPRGVVDLYA